MAPGRVWIMDGHNMIFAVPSLQRLQVTERREEARAGLADHLERFAIARGETVLLVFDGNQSAAGPGSLRRPFFEVAYARGGVGAADDRILREAQVRLERGEGVTVVTNDVATLAGKLPRGVRHLGVEEFWLKHIERRPAKQDVDDGEKRVRGDFSDLEREMLAQAALVEPAPRAREPLPQTARKDEKADRLALKRERGRIRQERRLRRQASHGRRGR